MKKALKIIGIILLILAFIELIMTWKRGSYEKTTKIILIVLAVVVAAVAILIFLFLRVLNASLSDSVAD